MSDETKTLPEFIDQRELARRLGVSSSAVEKWRLSGGGPPHVRIGRQIRFSVDAVRAWIDARTVGGRP